MKESIEQVSQNQKERLFFLDLRLRFLGSVYRNDLIKRFGIQVAAATRDIALYRKLAKDNLYYDVNIKRYLKAASFRPLFNYSDSQAISAVCDGLGDDQVEKAQAFINSESPIALNTPNINLFADVTQAIHLKMGLTIEYHSFTSGETKRTIIPFALVNNGKRWHIRAFDIKKARFADFVVNRVVNPKIVDIEIEKHQSKEADHQWNRFVELHIVPHPNLQYPKTVEIEYSMLDGKLITLVRAAVAGYVLRHWNVDCSIDHTGENHYLWLSNHSTLYGVKSSIIAPNYTAEKL
ncbi:MAG: WYL domain-containing protein [Colwellia sp.]